MNDEPLIDADLQSIEAHLSVLSPQLIKREQELLLYECGRAAGARAANQLVRRWQLCSAALALLFVGVSLALTSVQFSIGSSRPAVGFHEEPEFATSRRTESERSLAATTRYAPMTSDGFAIPPDPLITDPLENIEISFAYRLRVP